MVLSGSSKRYKSGQLAKISNPELRAFWEDSPTKPTFQVSNWQFGPLSLPGYGKISQPTATRLLHLYQAGAAPPGSSSCAAPRRAEWGR